MSVTQQLQKDCGGQWLYIKATRKGEAVWRNHEGRIAIQVSKNGTIVVMPINYRESK